MRRAKVIKINEVNRGDSVKEKRPRDKKTQKLEYKKRGRRISDEKDRNKKPERTEGKEANDVCGWKSEGRKDKGELKYKTSSLIFFFSKNKAERLEVPKGTETHVELTMFMMTQNWVQERCRLTVHGQVIWASPGRWLEMPNLKYQPRPTDSEWTS